MPIACLTNAMLHYQDHFSVSDGLRTEGHTKLSSELRTMWKAEKQQSKEQQLCIRCVTNDAIARACSVAHMFRRSMCRNVLRTIRDDNPGFRFMKRTIGILFLSTFCFLEWIGFTRVFGWWRWFPIWEGVLTKWNDVVEGCIFESNARHLQCVCIFQLGESSSQMEVLIEGLQALQEITKRVCGCGVQSSPMLVHVYGVHLRMCVEEGTTHTSNHSSTQRTSTYHKQADTHA